MKFLLDTNVLLWVLLNDPQLSSPARLALSQDNATTYASMASLWEIAIKQSINKLKLPGAASEWLSDAIEASNISILRIEATHATGVGSLPWHHRDPFDRLIIVQAKLEAMTVLTRDRHFALYGVDVLVA